MMTPMAWLTNAAGLLVSAFAITFLFIGHSAQQASHSFR